MYETWCCCPVATLTLCLLAQEYALGVALINYFSQCEINCSVEFLIQIDKLVHLLESPVFIRMCM